MSKNTETVTIIRDKVTREIPKKQWDNMGKNTFGWKLKTEVPDELKEAAEGNNTELEQAKAKIVELNGEIVSLKDEKKNLEDSIAAKDTELEQAKEEQKQLNSLVESSKANSSELETLLAEANAKIEELTKGSDKETKKGK